MRLKFFLAFILVGLVTIGSVLYVASQQAASEVRTFMRGSLMGIDTVARDLEAYYQVEGSWRGVDTLLRVTSRGRANGMGGMMGGLRLILADKNGRFVASSSGQARANLTVRERFLAIDLKDSKGKRIGYLLAEGGQGSSASEALLVNRLTRAGLVGAGVSLVLALFIALLLSYSLLRPIQDLTRAASRMAGGDLSQRVSTRGQDEVSQLGKAFNRMAESLERVENNRRAVTADIAHELRTPIAIQRAHLEALQDGIYSLTGENLQPVLDQTEVLTRLVEDLRTLALADSGELRLERIEVDFKELLHQVVERFRPEAESRRIRLRMVIPDTSAVPLVKLDPVRIEQVLNNILSNAMRYAPESGEVQVTMLVKDGWIEVVIADNGPGIPEDAIARLFERFFRADTSRSHETGRTGLGLAIARQLTLAHGGEIRARNQPGGGAEFRIRFPLRD